MQNAVWWDGTTAMLLTGNLQAEEGISTAAAVSDAGVVVGDLDYYDGANVLSRGFASGQNLDSLDSADVLNPSSNWGVSNPATDPQLGATAQGLGLPYYGRSYVCGWEVDVVQDKAFPVYWVRRASDNALHGAAQRFRTWVSDGGPVSGGAENLEGVATCMGQGGIAGGYVIASTNAPPAACLWDGPAWGSQLILMSDSHRVFVPSSVSIVDVK